MKTVAKSALSAAFLASTALYMAPDARAAESANVLEVFRVLPYQQQPSSNGILLTWFTESDTAGDVEILGGDLAEPIRLSSTPEYQSLLAYRQTELDEAAADGFPVLGNDNYKHSVEISGLNSGTTYTYRVTQGEAVFESTFSTAPNQDDWQHIRFVALADAETEPRGTVQIRDWSEGAQAEGSLGRPSTLAKDSAGRDLYLLDQTEGYAQNLRIIGERHPNLVIMPGDLVQGGGYQLGWDEFFRHNAGAFDDLLTQSPIVPALGNWENYGAVNGEYTIEPDYNAVAFARSKYKVYFDMPANGTAGHQDNYYRVDYGPLTIITLDSSNGEPEVAADDRGVAGTPDTDTNTNIDSAVFRANNSDPSYTDGTDLSDFNPGSVQAAWLEEQLKDARAKGQIIFVQYHHAAYSSGTHGIPNAGLEGVEAKPTGQAGTPLRQFTPLFDEFGVAGVLSGHSEIAERSLVNPDASDLGVNYFDVGVAGDGMRGALSNSDLSLQNPYSQWVADLDALENWAIVTDADGSAHVELLGGGKHYGHLEINLYRVGGAPVMTSQMVYSFPLMDAGSYAGTTERRIYDDVQMFTFNQDGTPASQTQVTLLEGSAGPDVITGTAGPDFVIGRRGGDRVSGGPGMDAFIYTDLGEAGDTIADFAIGEDVIDLATLLGALGINTKTPIEDGYVRFTSLGDHTFVLIDADGNGPMRPQRLIRVENVSRADLQNAANFLF